jgi:hypothetical protein
MIPPPEADPDELSLTDEIRRTILSDDEERTGNIPDYSKIAPLTPNLTRTAEPAPPVQRPVTNLSVVTSIPPVRNASIPLPPVIPDIDSVAAVFASDRSIEPVEKPAQEVASEPLIESAEDLSHEISSEPLIESAEDLSHETGEASRETQSLSHLWSILIKRWEDTMIMESLQLRHARVEIHNDVLRVIFPDIMRSYIDQLTQRIEYKRIKEDAMTLIKGVRELRMMTDSDTTLPSDSGAPNGNTTGKGQPDWVGRIKAFAEQNGVEVQTIDDM